MKKITFNALLNHKAHNYKPMQIEVEKVIPLYGKRFEQMRDHPLEDVPEITENRDLMYMKGNTAHCILFLDANGNDGILVEAEGSDYTRKSEFISNARAIIEQSEFTYGERQLHAELKAIADRIAELAHTGQTQFTFEEMLGDGNMKAIISNTAKNYFSAVMFIISCFIKPLFSTVLSLSTFTYKKSERAISMAPSDFCFTFFTALINFN